MASPGLRTPRAIGGCSLGQLIMFYLSLMHRLIYNMPSTVGGTHGAPSTLRANDDTRMRSGAEKNMIETTVSLCGVRSPELSRQRLRPAAQPGDGRGTTTTTPLPGIDIIIADRRTHVEYRRSLHVLGPFNGPLTSKSPTSTSTSLSRIWEAGWPSTPRRPSHWGDRRCDDHILAHRPRAGCTAMATTPTPTLHRRLERLQSAFHRQISISLRQSGAAMGPQIHQAPRG
jgi:hypothetical protein